jgi:hypothetical protein
MKVAVTRVTVVLLADTWHWPVPGHAPEMTTTPRSGVPRETDQPPKVDLAAGVAVKMAA